MPVIPRCGLLAIETRAVVGVGTWPVFGPRILATNIARAIAQANAGRFWEDAALELIEQFEREYRCTDNNCPVTQAAVELPADFKWRKLTETYSGGLARAVWALEMEFIIGCDPAEGPSGPPGGDDDSDEPEDGEDGNEPEDGDDNNEPQYGYFDKDRRWHRWVPGEVEDTAVLPDCEPAKQKTKTSKKLGPAKSARRPSTENKPTKGGKRR